MRRLDVTTKPTIAPWAEGESVPRYKGSFWLAGNPDHTVRGTVSLNHGWPVLDVDGELEPTFTEVEITRPDGTKLRRREIRSRTEARTIHGSAEGAGCVTLTSAVMTSQRITFPNPEAGQQTYRARFALTHPSLFVDDEEQQYVGIKVALGHLEAWTRLDGKTMGIRLPDQATGSGGAFTVSVFQAPSDHEDLAGGGALSFDHAIGERDNTPTSHTVWRRVSYHLNDLVPDNLDGLTDKFVRPLVTITSLCVNAECRPIRLSVAAADAPNDWFRVYGPITAKRPRGTGRDLRPLLPFSALKLSGIASWISNTGQIDPLAEMLTSTLFSNEQTPALRVFNLAATAEGLHRRLFDDVPKIDKATARIVQKGCKRIFARLGDDVVKAISDGLAFLTQPSFSQRLLRLVTEVETVQPGICGTDIEAWVTKVRLVRNRMAHQLHKDRKNVTPAEQEVLWRSLYWLLAILLLKHAGVSVDALRAAVRESRDFSSFMSLAQSWMPDVYIGMVVAT